MDKTDAALKVLEKRIKTVYTKAYQELKDEAAAVLAKIEMNPDMTLAQKMGLMAKYDRVNKLSEQLANTVYNANKMAQKMINGEMVNIYELNYNESAKNLGFSLVDHTVVKKILTQEENPFIKISALEDKIGIRNEMKGQLMTGLLKGESIPKIARRLKPELLKASGIPEDQWGLKKISQKYMQKSIMTARTETTRVQNSAKMDIGKEGERLGFNMWKRWVATKDDRVRGLKPYEKRNGIDHDAMDGVEVPLNEPFTLPDGSKVMFPGDISMGAPPEQTINCRCTMIEFIKEADEKNTNNEENIIRNDKHEIEEFQNNAFRAFVEKNQDYASEEFLQEIKYERPTETLDEYKSQSYTEEQKQQKLTDMLMTEAGYDSLPEKLSIEDYESGIKSGDLRVFRATDDKKFNDQFLNGDFWVGGGVYGNGTYCSPDRFATEKYGEQMFEFSISRQAKVVEFEEIFEEYVSFLGDIDVSENKVKDLLENMNSETAAKIFYGEDLSRFATLKGYDVIKIPADENGSGSDYYNILNRGIVKYAK